jgi:hypothetical protein
MTVEELMQKLRLCNPKSTVHVGMPSGWEEADVFLFSKSSPAWVTTKPL